MYVLLKQEVGWVQHLKGRSCLFAAASQNLKPVWFLNYQNVRVAKCTFKIFKNGYNIIL